MSAPPVIERKPRDTALSARLGRLIPQREHIENSRWLRPFAGSVLRSDLWRFTRRSVPRGVALGLFIGVIIPMAHFIVAALLAVFVRANVPAALVATFVGNPVTVLALWALAYKVGELMLHADAMTAIAPVARTMQQTQTDVLLQRITGAGLDTALGLLVIASLTASVGFLLTGWVWRWWVARKRAARLALALERRALRAQAGPHPLP
ncbi:DUF2062 domain-containing protein [Novosphingobium tardum]|uniref:DUF2062 domain-containing protein n=1 Tax=Novosphingobium tardum TaxID=1538021 RepID=A0ABV8RRE4_9SPHN